MLSYAALAPRARASTSRATFSGGVSGTMPWPRLKMNGTPAHRREDVRSPAAPSLRRRPPAAADRDCPAPPCRVCRARASRSSGIARVAADAVDARRLRRSASRCSPAPRGKPMIGTSGCRAFSSATIRAVGATTQRVELRRPAGCRPSCRRSAARRRRRAPGRRGTSIEASTSDVDQPGKTCAIAIGPQPRVRLIGRALARRPCRSRPSTARRKTRSAPSRAAGPGARAPPSRTRGQTSRPVASRRQAATARAPTRWASRRGPSPSTKRDALAERIGHDEDVGKQDRRVEADSGGSAAASPRRRARACSTDRGSRRPSRAPHGTPAGSARPAASARSAAAMSASPLKHLQQPLGAGLRLGDRGSVHVLS